MAPRETKPNGAGAKTNPNGAGAKRTRMARRETNPNSLSARRHLRVVHFGVVRVILGPT